jgi:DNA polymerase-3 subunit delta'
LTPLDKIPDQDVVKKIILNSLNKNRLTSTYLFYGSDGVGKWPMAIALAALLNCENPIKDDSSQITDACGECRNCRQILNLNFSELFLAVPIPPHKSESEAVDLNQEYIEQKKQEPYRIITSTRQLTIPISTARDIKRKTAIMAPEGFTRVILFYQMERMLPSSADSLLKLIEEPPPKTVIILTARDPENLLPTIQSRAQKIPFKPVGTAEITRYLETNYELPGDKAEFPARLSDGSIGRALDFVEDDEESSLRQTSFLIFKQIFLKDNPSAAATVNELINPNDRGGLERILSFWQSFLSDIITIKYGRDTSGVINLDLLSELENLSIRLTDARHIGQLLEHIKNVILASRRNVHIRPAMTAFVFNIREYINQSP